MWNQSYTSNFPYIIFKTGTRENFVAAEKVGTTGSSVSRDTKMVYNISENIFIVVMEGEDDNQDSM